MSLQRGQAGRARSSRLTRINPEEHLNMRTSFTLLTLNSNPRTHPAMQGNSVFSHSPVRKPNICRQTIVWKSFKVVRKRSEGEGDTIIIPK